MSFFKLLSGVMVMIDNNDAVATAARVWSKA